MACCKITLFLLVGFVLFPSAWAALPKTPPKKATSSRSSGKYDVYLIPGITLGLASTIRGDAGSVLGGELSLVLLDDKSRGRLQYDSFFMGLVADGLYDWGRDAGRFALSLEAGGGVLGLEFGYLMEIAQGEMAHGIHTRFFLSFGVAALYVRYGGIFHRRDLVEVGLLLKVPLPLGRAF
ncbi:MAG: hypothetical protein JRH20_27355 [Deltaproteobacteria bacterium]|nr:hypothetical protein [Deltaproteobacteria bacterium]